MLSLLSLSLFFPLFLRGIVLSLLALILFISISWIDLPFFTGIELEISTGFWTCGSSSEATGDWRIEVRTTAYALLAIPPLFPPDSHYPIHIISHGPLQVGFMICSQSGCP